MHCKESTKPSFEAIAIKMSEDDQKAIIFGFLRDRLSPHSLSMMSSTHDFKEALFASLLNEAIFEALLEHVKKTTGSDCAEFEKRWHPNQCEDQA